ncbi:FBXL2 isoform 22 [Pongo abelii]|uniref:FBXL2 isoform 22 n=1 Tax=Pongo abelii TaxID=9601 RepID=A0A2J8WYN4_PONAB|nr:FBXL2 isoform 22 [Pongo abelii]
MVFSNNDEGLINKKLPKELLLRMLFSLLLNFTWSNPECTKYVHSIGLDSFCNVHSMDFFKDCCLYFLLSVMPAALYIFQGILTGKMLFWGYMLQFQI